MYSFTNQFMSNDENAEFLKATMMGPNAMRLAEELAAHLNINENMRILDLGCGCGLSTLLLAKNTVLLFLPLTFGFRQLKTMSVLSLSGLMIRPFQFLQTRPKACLSQTDISTCYSPWMLTIISVIRWKCFRRSFFL